MTYTGGEYSTQDLLKELKITVKEHGITTFAEYADAVDALVEEKVSYGFFSSSEDLMQLKSDLKKRWPEFARHV